MPYIDENKIFSNDLETVKSRIDADMQKALDGMKKHEEKGLKGEVKTQPIIEALKARFMEKIGESYIDSDGARIANDLIQVLEGFGASVKGNDIIKIRRAWDKIIENNKGFAQSAETKTKGMVYETANKFFRNEIRNANPEYAKHLADYARTIALSDIVGATIERRIGQTRAGYIRQGLENTARVAGGGLGALTGGLPGAVIGGLATEGLMRGVGKLTGSSVKLALGKKMMMKKKGVEGKIENNKKLLTTKGGEKLLKNTQTQKNISWGKEPSPTGIHRTSIADFYKKSNKFTKIADDGTPYYTKTDGTKVEYKKPEGVKTRDFKKEAFRTNETFPLKSSEKVYLKNLDDVQIGKKLEGIIGVDPEIGNILITTKKYADKYGTHGPINNANVIATTNRWKYKIKNRKGNPDIVNYIKPFSENSQYGMLVGAEKTKSGNFVTTIYEPHANILEVLKKEKDKGGIITTKNKPSLKNSYTNRNLDAPTISQKEAKNIVRKYFKDDQVSVKLADRIVSNDGIEAFGMYKDKMIAFAKNPTKYAPEHEVFHAYFDMALKPKEKNAILKAIQKQENFKTKLDAEEFMADSFAEFVVGRRERSKYLTGKLQNIFQDLAYMFKEFFGKSDKVEGLYRELEGIGRGKRAILEGNNSGGAKFLKKSEGGIGGTNEGTLKRLSSLKSPTAIKNFLEKKGYQVEHQMSNLSKSEYLYITKEGSGTMKVRISDHGLPQKYHGSGGKNIADYELEIGSKASELESEIHHFFTHGKTKQAQAYEEAYRRDTELMKEIYNNDYAKEVQRREQQREQQSNEINKERQKHFVKTVGNMIYENKLTPTLSEARSFAKKIFGKPGIGKKTIPTIEKVEARLLAQGLVKYKKGIGIVRYLGNENESTLVADKGARFLKNGGQRTPSIEWKKGLELFEKGELPAHNTLSLGVPTGILAELVGKNELTITQKRLRNKSLIHKYNLQDIAELAEEIKKPLLIYEAGEPQGRSLVVITDLSLGNNKIAVGISYNRGKAEVSEIKSIHQKSVERLLHDKERGKIDIIHFEDNKKISQWLGSDSSKWNQPTTNKGDYASIIPKTLKKANENTLKAGKGAKLLLAGENARNAPKSKLNEAQKMEALGKSADEIWKQTGWERGKDGKWRFEIDDNDAKILQKALGTYKLSEVLEHKSLFEQYPEMRDIGVKIVKNLDYAGLFNPADDTITIKANTNIKDTLLHEIQHWIQKKEGFSNGSSAKSKEVQERAMEHLVKKQTETLKHLYKKEEALLKMLNDTEENKQYNMLLDNYESMSEYMSYLYDDLKQTRKKIDALNKNPTISQGDLQSVYLKNSGEVEARNVEKRLELSKTERKILRPEKTEDTKRGEQWLGTMRAEGGAKLLAKSKIDMQYEREFNQLLQGKLPKNHIFQLGEPSSKMIQGGFSKSHLEIEADLMMRKSKQKNHPFNLENLRYLNYAIKNPIAIFKSKNKAFPERKMIFTTLKDNRTGENFATIFDLKDNGNANTIHNMVSVHPRMYHSIESYLKNPKLSLFIDQEKLKRWKSKKLSQ